MSWELIGYDDFTIPLITTDVDEMQKMENGKSADIEKTTEKRMDIDGDQAKDMNGDQAKKDINNIETVTNNGNLSLVKTIQTGTPDTCEVNGVNEISKDDIEEKTIESGMKVDKQECEAKECSKGKFLALKIQFQLPSSCYATTALRELLSCDSSFQAQSQLNDNFNKKTEHNCVK